MAERLTKKLTVRQIDSLRPKARPYEALDGDGLYVTVRPNGSKSFNLRYRFGGRPKNLTIGPVAIGLAEARRLAQEARAEIARGNDPCAQKAARKEAAKAAQEPTRDSIAEIVQLFLEKHARPKTRPNSARETERLLRREIGTRWGDRKLSTVTRGDVRRLLEEIEARAPIVANRTLAAFRKLCAWAVERDIIEGSPCDKLKPVAAENSRDRVLSDDELAAVWRASGGLGFPFGPLFQLLVLTGQRRSEVAGASWAEIDLASALWTIPAARSKNGLEHRVPLSPQALQIIEGLPRFGGGQGFLFSSGDTPPSGFSRAKRRLDDALSPTAKASGDDAMPPFAWHDLRRTAVSGMARLGVSLPVIERCVNHISGSFAGVVGVYQKHQFDDEKRAALNAWGEHVESLAGGTE